MSVSTAYRFVSYRLLPAFSDEQIVSVLAPAISISDIISIVTPIDTPGLFPVACNILPVYKSKKFDD